MVSAVFLQTDSSEIYHLVNAQVLLWLLCDCYNDNAHDLQSLQTKIGLNQGPSGAMETYVHAMQK